MPPRRPAGRGAEWQVAVRSQHNFYLFSPQATIISAKDACPSHQQPASQPRNFYGVVFPQELGLVREEKGRGVWRECTVEAVAEGGSLHALSSSLGKVGISSQ